MIIKTYYYIYLNIFIFLKNWIISDTISITHLQNKFGLGNKEFLGRIP